MNKDRYNELMNDPNSRLTDEEIAEGYHFCLEWDGLLIHRDDPEARCCDCHI